MQNSPIHASKPPGSIEHGDQPAMNTYHLHLFNNHWALSEQGEDTPLKLYRDMPQEEACALACAYLKGSDSCLKIHDPTGALTGTQTFSPAEKEPAKK